jgi:hypothetical protein
MIRKTIIIFCFLFSESSALATETSRCSQLFMSKSLESVRFLEIRFKRGYTSSKFNFKSINMLLLAKFGSKSPTVSYESNSLVFNLSNLLSFSPVDKQHSFLESLPGRHTTRQTYAGSQDRTYSVSIDSDEAFLELADRILQSKGLKAIYSLDTLSINERNAFLDLLTGLSMQWVVEKEKIFIFTKTGMAKDYNEVIFRQSNTARYLIDNSKTVLEFNSQRAKAKSPESTYHEVIHPEVATALLANFDYKNFLHYTSISSLPSIISAGELKPPSNLTAEQRPKGALMYGYDGKVYLGLSKIDGMNPLQPVDIFFSDKVYLEFDLSLIAAGFKFHMSRGAYGEYDPQVDFAYFPEKNLGSLGDLKEFLQIGSPREVVFYFSDPRGPQGIPLSYLKSIWVPKSYYEVAVNLIKSSGILKINNIPLEQFIRVFPTN